jgi:hypothetical protein
MNFNLLTLAPHLIPVNRQVLLKEKVEWLQESKKSQKDDLHLVTLEGFIQIFVICLIPLIRFLIIQKLFKLLKFKSDSYFVEINAVMNSRTNKLSDIKIQCEPKLANLVLNIRDTFNQVINFAPILKITLICKFSYKSV